MFKPTFRFIYITCGALQIMFLCPGPVLKLLRERLAAGGLSCGMALVTNSRVQKVRSYFVLDWGGLEGVAIVLISP